MNQLCVCLLATQSCPPLCDPMDCSPPGSSVHGGVLQTRILEWVAIPFSRGIFPTQGSNLHLLLCRQILYHLTQLGSARGVHLSPLFLDFLPMEVTTNCWVAFPVVCNKFSLVIYFIQSISSEHVSISISQFLPPHPTSLSFYFLLPSLPYSSPSRVLKPLLSTSCPRFTCNRSQCRSGLCPRHPHQPSFLTIYPLVYFA